MVQFCVKVLFDQTTNALSGCITWTLIQTLKYVVMLIYFLFQLKQIARSHGRNRGQPNSNHQNTYAKFQPYPAIKEEPTDNYQIPAAFSTAALPVKEERVESSIRGEESMASDTGSWQEVKKKPRNRRSRRKNKAAGTQTNTVGTDEIGEELSDMLNSLCHFEAPSLLSPIKEGIF